jgi:GNAT superfamily N-acetyltransferase
MAHPVEADDPRVAALLAEDRVGNLVIEGDLANSRPGDVKLLVDDLDEPAGLLAIGWWVRVYARDRAALERLRPAIPRRHPMAEEETDVGFGGVAAWACDEIRSLGTTTWENLCWLWHLPSPDRLPDETEHETAPLRPEDTALVNEHWPHGDEPEYVRWRIEAGPSAAVFEDGAPVSWAMTHGDEEMGFMTTLPEARRRGLARSVSVALSRAILERGKTPFLYTLQENEPAQRLAEDIGFERWGAYHWFGLRRSGEVRRTDETG